MHFTPVENSLQYSYPGIKWPLYIPFAAYVWAPAGVSSNLNTMIYKAPWDPGWKGQFRPGLSALCEKHASVNQLLIMQLPSVAQVKNDVMLFSKF